ncbi:MAG: NUDIX domain-containing protein [Burkholderiales bacterium]
MTPKKDAHATARQAPPRRFSAGVVVVRRFPEGWRCLVLRSWRNWDFPKGAPEPGETPLEAARREVAEESALADLEFRWGEIHCETAPYSGGKVARYYLALSPAGKVELPVSPELGHPEHHEFRWVSFAAAEKLLPPRLQPVCHWARNIVEAAGKNGASRAGQDS